MPEVYLFIYRHMGVLVFALFIFAPILVWGAEQQGKRYTLEEVLALGEEKNPSMEVFRANLASARGALSAASSYPNPELEAELGKGKALAPGATYERQYGFGMSQSLEWPGKRLNRREAAETQIVVAQQEFYDFQLEIAAQIKESFFNAMLSKRLFEIAIKNIETAQALVNSTQRRVSSGEAPALELIKARVELLRVTKDLKSAQSRVTITRSALSALLGGALRADDEIAGDFSGGRRAYALASLIEEAMARHPQIVRQMKALEAAGYTLSQEKQARFPDLTVKGTVSEEIDKRSYSVGLSIPLPFFYQRQGEIAIAQAGTKKAEADLERTRVELTKLIVQEFQNYRNALDQLNVFEEGLLKEADEALRIAQFSYEEGESDLLDPLDAVRVQRTILVEYDEAQFELQAALARLERVTGGLP